MGFALFFTTSTGLVAFLMILGYHKVEEGHIGLYYSAGKLQDKYTMPGFNWMFPILSRFENVQVTIQTDEVKNIPCGTSGGILIYFEKIEVVNRLIKELAVETVRNYTTQYDQIWIYDKIHHEINQFCSKHSLQEIYIDQFEQLDEQLVKQLQIDLSIWAPGIEIVAIRITKPRIPDSIRKNFEEMEQQRTNYLLEGEKQNVLVQQTRSKSQQDILKAQSELEVAEISIEREINEKLSRQQMAAIQDEMTYASEIAAIDSDIMTQRKELETSQMRLTPQYLQTEAIKALSSNVKFYIGERVPQYMGGQGF